MERRPAEIETRVDGDVGVVIARGEIDFDTAPLLAGAARELSGDHQVRRLIIDLRDLDFLDSSGLSALLQLRRDFSEITFRIPGDSANKARRSLERTGLIGALPIDTST